MGLVGFLRNRIGVVVEHVYGIRCAVESGANNLVSVAASLIHIAEFVANVQPNAEAIRIQTEAETRQKFVEYIRARADEFAKAANGPATDDHAEHDRRREATAAAGALYHVAGALTVSMERQGG